MAVFMLDGAFKRGVGPRSPLVVVTPNHGEQAKQATGNFMVKQVGDFPNKDPHVSDLAQNVFKIVHDMECPDRSVRVSSIARGPR